MRSVERAVGGAPHLHADADCLLEALVAFPQRRECDSQAEVLPLVPGRADPKPGATPREDVEAGDLLREEAGVAVGHPGREHAELHAGGPRGDVPEDAVRLEHLVLGRTDSRYLEVVVHHRDAVEAGRVGAAHDLVQLRREARRRDVIREVREVQSQLQAAPPLRRDGGVARARTSAGGSAELGSTVRW